MKLSIRNILFISLLSFSLYTNAQAPNSPNGMNSQLKGRVIGKVLNEKGNAIDFATVLLLKPQKDSLTNKLNYIGYQTTTTEGNGEFAFEDFLMMPKLIVRVSSYGYVNKDIDVPFDLKSMSMGILFVDLGKIELELEKTTELESVKIKATSPLLKLEGDKRVFDVSQNPISEGGTGVDVMQNVPGVNVDIDGNITVRNSAPQLYIDGRPTTLTLDQIPASAIEKVEVMTNPSAQFDASGGGAGIINIVLKKNKKLGYNGSVRAGMDSYLGYNGGGDISIRQKKIIFSLSLNGRANRGRTTSNILRENYAGIDTMTTSMKQQDVEKKKGGSFFGTIGLDYLPTNKTSFSIGADVFRGNFGSTSMSNVNTDSLLTATSSFYQRLNTPSRNMLHYGVKFGFKQLFKRIGEELTFDASYNAGVFKSESDFTYNYYESDKNSPIVREKLQKVIGSGNRTNTTIQVDYKVPLSVFKIETGLRAQLRGFVNVNNNYFFMNNDYQLMVNPASNYSNTDNVYAAYFMVSKQYKKFSYQAGLRAESSDYKGKLQSTGETFKVQYPISLFPSTFLSYKLTEKQFLQLNYSRRVNRPNFFQIVPFIDSMDVFNMTKGNASLKPEFTNNLELQYLVNFNRKNTLLASVYYKYTTNLITRYIEQGYHGYLINTYINANSSYSTGLELISTNGVKEFLDITTSVNIYNAKINSNAYQSYTSSARWAWFGKLNLLFKLPAQFTVQVAAIYQSKSSLPVSDGDRMWGPPMDKVQSTSQGYISDFWALDLSIRKTFFNKKLAVNLAVSDIFGTKHYISVSKSDFFYQNYDRLMNPYMVRLNLSWTFGKVDTSLFKRLSKGTGESSVE